MPRWYACLKSPVASPTPSPSVFHLYSLSVAWCGPSVHKTGCYLYTFIYIRPIRNVYTPSLFVQVRSLLSLVPIFLFFSRCICTRGPLTNRRAGLLRLAVSPDSLRGLRRWRLTPFYILPFTIHTCTDFSHTETDYDSHSVRGRGRGLFANADQPPRTSAYAIPCSDVTIE